MTPDDDYDPAKDSHDSYFAAIEAKRLRGDAVVRQAHHDGQREAPTSVLPAAGASHGSRPSFGPPSRGEIGSSGDGAPRFPLTRYALARLFVLLSMRLLPHGERSILVLLAQVNDRLKLTVNLGGRSIDGAMDDLAAELKAEIDRQDALVSLLRQAGDK